VIGASVGGVAALRAVLSALPADLPAAVIVVQHTGAREVQGLCEVLALGSALPVVEAQQRQKAEPAKVYLAPSGYHLLVEQNGRFSLSLDEKVCHVRPSVDVLFQSAVRAWGRMLIGVVLTGSNEDGAEGLKWVRRAGGYCIVQDPLTAESPEMPKSALDVAGADAVLPLDLIGPAIEERVRTWNQEKPLPNDEPATRA